MSRIDTQFEQKVRGSKTSLRTMYSLISINEEHFREIIGSENYESLKNHCVNLVLLLQQVEFSFDEYKYGKKESGEM